MFTDLPHILIVDDDERIRSLVSRYLWKRDFVATMVADAGEAQEALLKFQFDALVVDVMMPGMNGLDFTRFLREGNNTIPIILLTALGEVEDRISGFEKGADDYLPKPFEPEELVMRLKALLRRVPKNGKAQNSYKIGKWDVDLGDGVLLCEDDPDQVVHLTDLDVRLLKALIKHENEPVSREDLARLCNIDGSERAIDVQVTRIRKKLEEDPSNPKFLRTLRGKGYMLRTL
jgi:two-component system, OmpR family, phosphate regulon response regulator OmpR